MAALSGTLVSAPVVPFSSFDIYPSHKSTYGLGGLRTVSNLTERNSITLERREDLMIVAVESNDLTSSSAGIAFYILDINSVENPSNLTDSTEVRLANNLNWFPLDFGYGSASGGDSWVLPPPESSSSPGIVGSRSYDGRFFYVCIEDNLWKRVAYDFFNEAGTSGSMGLSHIEGGVNVWESGSSVERILVKNVEQSTGGQVITFTDNSTSFIPITNVDISYIRPDNTKIGVGGLPINSVVNFPTIQDALDAILYPFIASTISIGSNSLHERGTTVNKTLNYGITLNDGIVDTRDISLNIGDGFGFITEFTPLTDSGVYNSATNLVYTNNTNPYNLHQFKYEVSFTNSPTISSTLNVEFAAPTYYGSLDFADIDETNIKTLTKRIRKKSNDSNLSYTTSLNRFVYTYPSSYGVLTSIIDPNFFNITASFTMIVVNFTLADTSVESYNVYYNNSDTTLNGFNLSFNF